MSRRQCSSAERLHSDCVPPVIELAPNGSLRFLRNENFYITSNVSVNCTPARSFTAVWSVLACSPACEQSIERTLPLEITHSELFVPAQTLVNGVYELKYTVSIVDVKDSVFSASIFVSIVPTSIFVYLLPYTAINITHDHRDELIFDPGKHSIDLHAITFNAEVSRQRDGTRREWTCVVGLELHVLLSHTLGLHTATIRAARRAEQRLSWESNHSRVELHDREPISIEDLGTSTPARSELPVHGSISAPRQCLTSINRLSARPGRADQIADNHHQVTRPRTSPLFNDDLCSCIVSPTCSPAEQFFYVSSSTQLALFSFAAHHRQPAQSTTWQIYQGSLNIIDQKYQWSAWPSMVSPWFFGNETRVSNLLDEFTNF